MKKQNLNYKRHVIEIEEEKDEFEIEIKFK